MNIRKSWKGVALVAALASGAAFGDITVHDGETLLVGTIGSGINNKNDDSIITLEAGATLKGTNDPPYGSWSIWRNLYATNGVACLDCSEMNYVPTFKKHIILTNGLVVRDQTSVLFNDTNKPGDGGWFFRDLAGLSFEGGSGSVTLVNQTTLVSTPTDANVTCTYSTSLGSTDMKALAIAGPNLRIAQVQDDPADFTALDKVYLFDDSYIPAGHSIKVGAATFRIHPATVNRSARSWVSVSGSGTVTHALSLSGGTLELCAPQNASYAFQGTVSGSGTINLRRDLAPSLTTCAFAKLDGQFAFRTGVSGRTASVTVADLAPGSAIDDGGVVNVTFTDPEVASRVQALNCADGAVRYVMADTDGSVPADALPTASRRLSDYTALSGETAVSGMPAAGTRLGAAAGARVTVTHDGSRAVDLVPGEGTLVVTSGVSTNLPLYWFDASLPYDWTAHGGAHYAAPASANTEGKDFGNIIMSNNFPYVETWRDWRGVTSGKLYLGRYYQGSEFRFYPHGYPYLALGAGPNGLGYLSFGVYNDLAGKQSVLQTNHADKIVSSVSYNSKRRLDFVKSVQPRTVVMVFGSQQGGGIAVLGTGSARRFRRTGRTLADALVETAPENTTFHLDGQAVADPTAQTFNGGWQILSISGDAVRETTILGADADYNDAGGQNYGEIIFFEDVLTDQVRTRYEQYLAKKWGVATYAGGAADVVRASGRTGTLELDARAGVRVELQGTFAGTVTLKGGALAIAEPLPPAADALPSEGRLHWFDADSPGSIVNATKVSGELNFTNVVSGFLERGRSYSEVEAGEYYLYGIGDRAPFSVRATRGLAAERTWIDFNHPADYPLSNDDGNTLRFATFSEARSVLSPAQAGVTQTFRTAFMAMDSSQGGGSPLLSETFGNAGDFRGRVVESYTSSLWKPGCAVGVTGGVTRVNGEVVDGTRENALTGGPETLTLAASANVSAAFVDSFSNTQSYGTPKQRSDNGLVFGELLLYATVLGADDVARVEAYLQGKWTGTLPAGYSDLREATVGGTGTLTVPDAARLPRIASTFSGSVAVGGDAATFTFTIDATGALTGAFDTPATTYDLPPAVTLAVNAAKRVPAGKYPLFVCRGLAHEVAWNLDLQGAPNRVCSLATETQGETLRVVLDVQSPGLTLFLR